MRTFKKSGEKFRQTHAPLLAKLQSAKNISIPFKQVAIDMMSYHDIITQTLKATKAELSKLLLELKESRLPAITDKLR